MTVPAKPTYPLPGLYGWAATAAVVVAYDVWAAKTGHSTMSRTLGHYLGHPLLGPVLAGAWFGLSYHLTVEELIPEIQAARAAYRKETP